MILSLIPFKTGQIPKPADSGRADAGLIRLRESLDADTELAGFYESLAGDTAGRALLEAVFGNSPYLGRCLIQEAGCVREMLTGGPDASYAALLSDLERTLGHETSLSRVTAGLRRAKRRASLIVGLADIAGLWTVERVTGALTDLAELCLHIATRYVLGSAAAQGSITLSDASDPEQGSGYTVLGMGKLGARELNYSSDIDLIVVYDADRVHGAVEDDLGPIFVKATRQLLHLMDARTEDGYVFRTDLRLRPDPGATPVAISAEAAEA
jgi:glutamate-ammonia-ligase adenylyltransferase